VHPQGEFVVLKAKGGGAANKCITTYKDSLTGEESTVYKMGVGMLSGLPKETRLNLIQCLLWDSTSVDELSQDMLKNYSHN